MYKLFITHIKRIAFAGGKVNISKSIYEIENCKMDVKNFVFIKIPHIENTINVRQHFLIYLKLTTLPIKSVVLIIGVLFIKFE